MLDVGGVLRRVRRKGAQVAADAPGTARRAARDARSTVQAVGEVLDDRSGGRLGEAAARGGEIVGAVTQAPRDMRDAFREEVSRDTYRPESYTPDPIDAPAPIDRPEPL